MGVHPTEVNLKMRSVLRQHCPEQGIGSVTVNDSARAAQYGKMRMILNFQR